MKRVYNFSAGPSMLPLSVLQQAAAEMTDAHGSGQSVLEMSHRSKDFTPIIEKTEALLRSLMGIPANYRVLFLQGGASLQFSMIPLNLAGVEPGIEKKPAFYVETGIWSKKAEEEGAKYVDLFVGASSQDRGYTYIPTPPPPRSGDAYYHLTWNNTIVGTRWTTPPETGNVPLVADISSSILSEPLEVSRFGLLYAGAQKNLGPAGTTVVIIRDDLIGKAPSWVPVMLRYDIHAKEGSLYNTPPCYGIYLIGLVLEWLHALGGVSAIAERNQHKAALLYDYLDHSCLFRSPVDLGSRSLMNLPFVFTVEDPVRRADLEKRFIREAAARGLVNLAGHRLVGGMRASLYNAMPLRGVQELVRFMEDFEAQEKGGLHVSHPNHE
ncbi:MAG: 3-phosphoserine/phosphohydroxythreonine transaminase [Spirochaetaceae bacterium]|jgi:phosphoserine aminotransferase|nr:3-phosphoserine/phosphohydroxythreonine transaminase [Spirochaetaceae bacterium]